VKKKVKKLPLSKITLAQRDDIAFRIYYIMTHDVKSIELWAQINRGRKQRAFRKDYIEKIYKWIKKDGKVKKPIYYRPRKGKFYTSGGSRLASAYVLGFKTIVGTLGNLKVFKSFNIDGRRFNGMPEDIIERLKIRKKIHSGLPILEYSIPQLSFIGNKKSKPISFGVIKKVWYDVGENPKAFLLEYKKLNE